MLQKSHRIVRRQLVQGRMPGLDFMVHFLPPAFRLPVAD
jgi:hypothetical protein